MDPTRFDAITKSVGQAPSRRTVLTTLGAATLGALGLAGSEGRAGAARGGNSGVARVGFCPGGQERSYAGCLYCGPHAQAAFDRKFDRFVYCVNNKALCEGRPGQTCCEFCSGWA